MSMVAIPVLIGIIATCWVFYSARAIPRTLHSFGALLIGLLLVSAFTLMNLAIRWLRWHFLLRHLDVRIPGKRSLHIFTSLLPSILTPGYVGELFSAVFLRPYTRRPFTLAVGLWLATRSADVLVLLLFCSPHANFGLSVLLASLIALTATLIATGKPSLQHRVMSIDTLEVFVVNVVMSVAAWTLPVASLYLLTKSKAGGLHWSSVAYVFAHSSLRGGLIPGGVLVAGSDMIDNLQQLGFTTLAAVQTTAVVRGGTVGFALALGLMVWFTIGPHPFRLGDVQEDAQAHFDDLAEEYADQISPPVRDRLIQRKIDFICKMLARHRIEPGALGLDIGCGHAWYATELCRRGYCMSACDQSSKQLAAAEAYAATNRVQLNLTECSVENLNYRDESFDFVYCVNVLHHVTSREHRSKAWREVMRVLKPGGVFILHEINVKNPIFRFYMAYVFPLLNRIDDGTERWILPTRLPAIAGGQWEDKVFYFTFMPDFAPSFALRPLSFLEQLLERTPLRLWSAHFMVTFLKSRKGP